MRIILILLFTFLIYSPALHHEFVNLDDTSHILENEQIRSLSSENINKIFTSTVQRTYIPLTIFSFAIDYQFAGYNPFLYHLNNILLHLLIVFLIFKLGKILGLSEIAAAMAAFIFALHPMHVESVAWVTERKDVLYSVFYLSAILFYLSFLKTNNRRDYIFSISAGFLSILAKPMALSLPLLLLFCDWFYTNDLKKINWQNKIPYALLIFPVAWVTYQINTGIVRQDESFNALFPIWSSAFYLKKFFWPDLFVPHYLPPPIELTRFEIWSSLLLILACAGACFASTNRWLRFAFLWFLLSIFFLLNFNPERVVNVVADRYMYLPSVGFCFLIGYAAERIDKRFLIVGVIILTAFFSFKTFNQVKVWKDSLTLHNYTIKHNPKSYLAYNNRGRTYEKQKHYDLAFADYKETIRLNPKFEKGYKNLASIYEIKGDFPAAIDAYTKAILVNPNYSGAYNNRGLLLEKKGDIKAALEDYTRAINADPNYLLGYINRGALLLKQGKIDQAQKDCRQALVLDPKNPSARAICSAIEQKVR